MSKNSLAQVKALFDLCEPKLPKQRDEILADPTLDQSVVKEVKQLLAIAEQTHEHHLDIISKQMVDMSQNLSKGQRLGAYQIESEIGRGGMGIVFLAQRADGVYSQHVAIKVAPSFASTEELERFHQERQILAQLQHPNIAILLDGGTTEDNRPYLVMEFIEGSTITSYCQQRKLSLNERLALFIEVCNAVSFAHRHLIIHRDIKPANVLVTEQGQVKLLDFGVSKVLKNNQQDVDGNELSSITLAYSSPEQINGMQTTTATDVYGLGCLLFELLTDQQCNDVENVTAKQLVETICHTEPELASRRVKRSTEGEHFKELQGDLDNILAKALRKLPEQRYRSVSDLSRDITAYLQGELVQATPITLSYRVKKFFFRHPWPVMLSAGLFTSLVFGLTSSLLLTKQLQREVTTSNQVVEMMTEMFDLASPEVAQGKNIDVIEFVRSTIAHTSAALEEDPIVKIRLLETLVDVAEKVGLLTEAISLQEKVIFLSEQQNYSSSLIALKSARLGNLFLRASELEQATQLIENAHLEIDSNSSATAYQAAMAKSYMSYLYIELGQIEKALQYAKQGMELYKKSHEKNDLTVLYLTKTLSGSYYQSQQYDKAISVTESLIEDAILLHGSHHPFLVELYADLGLYYTYIGKVAQSMEVAEKGYQLAKDILQPNTSAYIHASSRYADVLKKAGRFTQAISVLEDEVAINPAEDAELFYVRQRAPSYMALGYFSKAKKDFQKLYTLASRSYPAESVHVFPVMGMLGLAKAYSGELSKGRALLNKAIKHNIKGYGENDPGVATSQMYLAHIEMLEHNYDKAIELLSVAEQNFATVVPEGHYIFAETATLYAKIYARQGKWQQAAKAAQQALAIYKGMYLSDSPVIASVESLLGEIRWHLGEKEAARRLLKQSADAISILSQESMIYQQAMERLKLYR